MFANAFIKTEIPGWQPLVRGKVRDIYDLGDRLIIIATDRMSAFDWVNPVGIPDKGRVLTQLSLFWFSYLKDIVKHHLISADVSDLPAEFQDQRDSLAGRTMIVHKCQMLPIECVVRGYLAGSGWKEYKASGRVCGIELPQGLQESSRLDKPIFTPATKATEGHDINITTEEAARLVGRDVADEASRLSIALYDRARQYAETRGIILCDTKFEFGLFDGQLMLADEVLTPDSSRFWPMDQYQPGRSQPSFDKQFVRDWLESTHWDKNSPPPPLPAEVVEKTRAKYIEAYERLTGKRFEQC